MIGKIDGLMIKTGNDIEPADLGQLAAILNFWAPYSPKNADDLKQRIDYAADNIVAGYVMQNGVYRPSAIGEALNIRTDGDLERFAKTIGRNYETLTGDGSFATNMKKGYDTVMFIDVTVANELQGNGIADQMLDYMRLATRDIKNRWTYSPAYNNRKAERLHERKGAKLGIRIENARPLFRPAPDVSVMVHTA